ncbi:MAG: MBOAT family protein, partial [Lachnospiraceae bacterium]|nr:MBOAT family protein [Lachnospiraceae bacterium]
MLFNTTQYLIFLPAVVLVYYSLPTKVRYIWLLLVSYYFYMQWNPLYILLLFSCTVITYVGGRMIGHPGMASKNRQRFCLTACILINLGILVFFKYAAFAARCFNRLFALMQVGSVDWGSDILLPVGISFYMLQALGYLIDVYRGDVVCEKNFFRYALFVSFFPQLVAGPIERSKNLLMQLRCSYTLRYENIRRGSLLVLYGLFLKMVIADRAAVIVDTVYGNVVDYPGFYIVVATIFFAIQIYCDFYGYTTVARGSALLMGIELTDNFNAPYYAQSVKEFWQRWHISLSSWFRDYLYIPLGGNRKGSVRRDCNMLAVFTVSGLWHGASWNFVLWGIVFFMLLSLEK